MLKINTGQRIGKRRLVNDLCNSQCENKELQQIFDEEVKQYSENNNITTDEVLRRVKEKNENNK